MIERSASPTIALAMAKCRPPERAALLAPCRGGTVYLWLA